MNSFHTFIWKHGKVAENSSSNLINKLDCSKKACLICSWKCQEDSRLQETPLQQLCLWKTRSKRQSYNKHYINIISILHRLFSVLLSYSCILGNNSQAKVFSPTFHNSLQKCQHISFWSWSSWILGEFCIGGFKCPEKEIDQDLTWLLFIYIY